MTDNRTKTKQSLNNRRTLWTAGLIIIAVIASILVFRFVDSSASDSSDTALATNEDESTSITVAHASSQLFYPIRSAPAEVEALNRSRIPAEITARIDQINVRVGDTVTNGQVLAELDCDSHAEALSAEQARLVQLQNQLGFDQRELKRGEDLARRNSISEALVDQRVTSEKSTRAQITAQQAMVRTAELNVERCQLKSPFDGVVLARTGNVGELLNPGNVVLEVLQTDEQDVIARIALTDVRSFESAVDYTLVAAGNRHELEFRTLLPVVEDQSQSREARLNLVSDQALTGATGRLEWTSPIAHLPARLLQQRDGEYGVFVIENDTARFVIAEGAQEGRPVALDIDPDVLLAIDGRHGLSGGDPVTVDRSGETD